jgi:hypothetical protein
MSLLKGLNLTLAFLLELVALGAFAYWGFTATDSTVLNIVLAIGLAVLAIVLWGIFAAPKSTRRLRGGALIAFKVVFFALACAALFAASSPTLGVIFGVAVAVNLVLAYVWKQETL